MNAKASNIISELNKVWIKLRKPLTIVETGTIRYPDCDNDGNSTRFIAEWIRDNEPLCDFFSIDIDTSKCVAYMNKLGLSEYAELIEGNSLKILPEFIHIDFCYLDSANDAENTMNEFNIVWNKITKGGCVMVDDCNTDRADLLKGDLLIPYVIENDLKFKIFNTNQIVIIK